MERSDPTGALSGLVVADFSRVLAGPLATMLLADLGATVIKVERPGSGDDTRSWGPPWRADVATYYLAVNRNKRSVVLDLTTGDGRAAAQELARRADVVVENFRPGGLSALGLGYEEVRGSNPGVVYCSISGFGEEGGASLPGYDAVAQAVGGLMSITGPEPDGGVKSGVALVDVLTGLYATVGILAALASRRATGEGQHVRTNLLSCLLASLVNQASGFLNTGAVPRALGNRHPSIAPYETLATADRPLMVAVGTDRQFADLCRVLGVEALAEDERFCVNAGRVAHREELAALLEAQLSGAGATTWWERLSAAGVPCGPVNDLAEAFSLAERLGLRPSVTLGPPGTEVAQVANPIELSSTPIRYAGPPPELGADSDAVLAWLASPAGPPP